MKTSNILIIAAITLILAGLLFYAFSLRQLYLSGDYKNPYTHYADLKIRDFDVVDLNASTAANVKFIQGPFSVKMDENVTDYVNVKQQGTHLQIDAVFAGDYRYNPNEFILVISCPALDAIHVNATYRSNGREVTDTIVREDWNMRRVLVDGFKQDSLTITQDYGSTVVLDNNEIRSLYAKIGISPGSGSKFMIQPGNRFGNASLAIDNRSRLILENAFIGHLNYTLADSAQLIVSGAAKHLINH